MDDCYVCESILALSAPGGCVHETANWFVDHCVGPLGAGTLIVKPKRHVVHVSIFLIQRASGFLTTIELPRVASPVAFGEGLA